MSTIRSLFSARRPLDRPIEKVIDYYAADEKRLAAEIEEYEATENVEACFRKFLEVYEAGVRRGEVTEVGVWVSGFYGSGKSSFTKYLGFALDPTCKVGGRGFLDSLCDRLNAADVKALLRTLAGRQPTAVVMLDLGAEQLADTAMAPVSTVLYWKVLQWAGFSKEKKLAQLEFTLDRQGKLDAFKAAYRERFQGDWEAIHNDPLIGVARGAQLVPAFLPKEFPTPESFRQLKFEEGLSVRDRAEAMLQIARKRAGCQNVLFLIDEAGQYVAPRGELILNLDGLARNLKELGQGKVWIAATGQQTLAEIVEKAAHNSAELNKLRDRFPIAINLDARDIREITYRRLLTKSPDGERILRDRFAREGQALLTHTRLSGTTLFRGDPDAETFTRLYPFLPQHFDLILELIRNLARSTGGIGLRSAIRVIQDLLVDASRVLPAGATRVADRPVGSLVCADDFYDTLRADIAKVLPHVTTGVDKVAAVFREDLLALRVAKVIAALQAVEGFPRSPENIAALLYPGLGAPSLLEPVRDVLRRLVAEKECGIIEDPKEGGYLFLSEGVKPLRDKRNSYIPPGAEINHLRVRLLATLFDPPPSGRLENVKDVKAGIRLGRIPVLGEDAEVQFRLEIVEPQTLADRRTALLAETNTPEYRSTIAWLVTFPGEVDDLLVEACRSDQILQKVAERDADKDVAQFLRAERRLMETYKDRAQKLIGKALLEGTFILRGGPVPVAEAGATLEAATRAVLGRAAAEIFRYFHLVPIRPATDLAARFLAVERLDRMPREHDPLTLVVTRAGHPAINTGHPALAEVLRTFQERVEQSGSGRLQGNAIQDLFADPPYGWSKDATRYLFAALLVAGDVELHTPGGTVRTSGPLAVEAMKSTVAFNRVGVSRRDGRPPKEALDRAATRLQEMFGKDVLPLEDHISRAVRTCLPELMEQIASLPDHLRLLGLPGEGRARALLETCADLLRGDASEAAARLGGTECAVPADVRWARPVIECLRQGGEADIRAAQALRSGLADLSQMFATTAGDLVTHEEAATLHEALTSEQIHERLPGLRGAVASITARIADRYADRRKAHAGALQEALAALEATLEWPLITPEDREEIARHFIPSDLPEVAQPGRELSLLRLILTREVSLPQLKARAEAEVRRRVPTPLLPPVEQPPAEEEPVNVADLAPAETLRTPADLDAWLAGLRARLMTLFRANKVIRIFRGPSA